MRYSAIRKERYLFSEFNNSTNKRKNKWAYLDINIRTLKISRLDTITHVLALIFFRIDTDPSHKE